MNTFLKKTCLLVALLFVTITAANARDAYSHLVLVLPDEPRNEQSWTRVINSQDGWEELFNESLAYTLYLDGEAPVAPVFDFNQYQVLSGGLGVRDTGGYQLVVSRVEERDSDVLIHVLMVRPSENCLSPMMISYPSATVLVKRMNKPFSFLVVQSIDECL